MERRSTNEHEEIVFEDEIDDVKIKDMKFHMINDGRGVIRQIDGIALVRSFKGLSAGN